MTTVKNITDKMNDKGIVEMDGKKYVSLLFVTRDLMSIVRKELKGKLTRLMVPTEVGGVTEFFEFNDTLDQAKKAVEEGINEITVELSKSIEQQSA